MKTVRQINIENRQSYFFNDMTNINDFDPNLLTIYQVSFNSSNIIDYEIKHIKDLNTSSHFYLVFNNLDAYIERKKIFDFCLNEKKTVLENYTELWDEIKEQIELAHGNKVTKYSKDFMKIRFESDDDLLINKIVNIPVCVIIVKKSI